MSGGFIASLFKKKVEEDEPSNLGLARVIKYSVLKKATNSFGTEIGSGGFGRVYLGKLPDGQQVAVKVLYDRNPKRIEQFFNEVTVLSRLRHKNLVTLYGCTNPRCQELLLVYDYVPNGTVADHLLGQQSTLTWAARVRIALETAEALRYLHGLEPPIIHRDVKTSNILLDHDFNVKLADLGMCRLLPWDTTHVSTRPQGTMGYRDPEYDRYLRLSDKTDVYSFGVVLLELISGQEAVDVNRDPENIYLDIMARNKILNKKLDELVDPKLAYQSNDDIRRMIDSVAELASECLLPTGDLRPPMMQVVTILKGIQNEMQQRGLNEFDVVLSPPQHKLNDDSLNPGTAPSSSPARSPVDDQGLPGISRLQVRDSVEVRSPVGGDPGIWGSRLPVLSLPYVISPINSTFRGIIGSWCKGELLGSGSFGTVYEAINSDGFFFATKEVSMSDQGTNAKQCINQLEQEIALLSQFEHENIVQYYGSDKEQDKKLFIFFELVTRGSLASLYRKYNLRDSQVSAYTRQILSGLKYLHDRNVVHRDIKCTNILVHANGSVKLADFGLSKEMFYLNVLKSCQGSIYWMAPEVIHPKKTYGPPADIWSLGCTVLEMLTRQVPYPNLEWREALFRIGRGEKPVIPDTLSDDAREFISQCVQVYPDDRPTVSKLLEHPFVRRSLPSDSSDSDGSSHGNRGTS